MRMISESIRSRGGMSYGARGTMGGPGALIRNLNPVSGYSRSGFWNRFAQAAGLGDDETSWLDVLNQGIETAGNVFVATRGGSVRTIPAATPGVRPTVTMSGSQSTGIAGMSTTTMLLIGAGVLAAVLLLKK